MPDFDTLSGIMKFLEDDYDAMIPRPATEEELEHCNDDLAEIALELIPDGYAEFLKMNNGFAWNGIEFYSTLQVTDPEENYTLMDLLIMNNDFSDAYELDEYFLMGRADDDYYTYNTETKKYEILEMSSRDVMEEFDTFEELFADAVGGRAASVYELMQEDQHD